MAGRARLVQLHLHSTTAGQRLKQRSRFGRGEVDARQEGLVARMDTMLDLVRGRSRDWLCPLKIVLKRHVRVRGCRIGQAGVVRLVIKLSDQRLKPMKILALPA